MRIKDKKKDKAVKKAVDIVRLQEALYQDSLRRKGLSDKERNKYNL